MHPKPLHDSARRYVRTLCSVQPNRRTGSPGNREAVRFFARTIAAFGYEVDTTPFPVLDYRKGGSRIETAPANRGSSGVVLHTSPYSNPVDCTAPLVVVRTAGELAATECRDHVLLMAGEICAEQLMPKNFPFYNPDHHRELIRLLEEKAPAAIITATAWSPEQVGAIHPFPLIVDGDFEIPNAHCSDEDGERLAASAGGIVRVITDGERTPAEASNAVATADSPAGSTADHRSSPRRDTASRGKVVLTAHIDAYEDSPGASDNASGCATLLLTAELLADYKGPLDLEFVAVNGEDHYSAAGEKDYLARCGHDIDRVRLVINVDDIGYVEGPTAWSSYECPPAVRGVVEETFTGYDGLEEGDPWWSGDHMVFVQAGRPAVAFTAGLMPELMRTVTHTERDTPDLLDERKLVEAARAIAELVRRLE
jgi:aminopeptidase YwaD